MESDDKTFIACRHCLAKNRVPKARLAEDPVCGRCGHALLPGEPVELSDANFDEVTRHTELPVIVDFWAAWCGPCRMMAPQFERAAAELKGRALFVKVDSDANPCTAQRFQVRSIPTLVKLNRGAEVDRRSGALPAAQIAAFAR
ncbi:thioredoxin TrxC [Paucibacter sp. R3-3]|uniref:Thioredoxin n=1 Tax=Roseateles agri TaxID=3098619 RepID=A0ABU5DHU6_9BURK|nr:thioredoxin TrxC [Paucibacter sp. R3-3]MDY0745290.1 thioredoxin TrxC [Paucibacter sp. R3-3]